MGGREEKDADRALAGLAGKSLIFSSAKVLRRQMPLVSVCFPRNQIKGSLIVALRGVLTFHVRVNLTSVRSDLFVL